MSRWILRPTMERPAADWPDMVHTLNGWKAAWVDLEGVHIDVSPPSDLPITSHLWAWTTSAWVRIRIDGDRWAGSGLFRGTGHPDSAAWRGSKDVDHVMTDLIRSWAPDDGRVAQRRISEGEVPAQMHQLVPVQAKTAVYVGTVESYRA